MKKQKQSKHKSTKAKTKRVETKSIDGHKPTPAFLAALKAVESMKKKD